MTTISRSSKAAGYCIAYLEIGEVTDSWVCGSPTAQSPYISAVSRYTGGSSHSAHTVPPLEATVFPTLKDARAWTRARLTHILSLKHHYRRGPSIIPMPAWILAKRRPAACHGAVPGVRQVA